MASSRKYQGFHLVFWFLGFTWWLWIPQRATCFSGRFKENPRMEFGWGGQRFPSDRWHKWSGLKIQMCDPKVIHSPALASSSTDAAISKDTEQNERNFIIWFLVVCFFGHPISAVFGFIMLKAWTSLGSLSLPLGQLCRFAWRGAGACFLSFFLSLVGAVGLEALWPTSSPFGDFALLLLAAGVEEFSKFIALIWLSWSSAKVWQRDPCASDWPKNRRVLMIAGLCVGVGFMVIENKMKVNFEWERLHIISQYLLRPQHLDFNWPVVWGKFMVMFIRDVVICNPHPYYCGIAAGQFASSVSSKSLTILDWLRILWLPSVLHFTHNVCSVADLKGLRWTVDVLTFLLFIRLWRKKGQQE